MNAHFGDKQGLEDQHALHGAGLFTLGIAPSVPVAIPIDTRNATRTTEKSEQNRQGLGIGADGYPTPPLTGLFAPAVAFPNRGIDGGDVAETLRAGCHGALPMVATGSATDPNQNIVCYDMSHGDDPMRPCGEIAPTLQSRMGTGGNQVPVAFAQNTRDEVGEMEVPGALTAQPGMKQTSYVRSGLAVRRLTPTECERLQGFPDGWTKYDSAGNDISDSARYRMLGNAIAVPVAEWIGRRIMLHANSL